MMVTTKPSSIAWIGNIPADWDIKKIKYISTLKGRIGWQGLTSDEYTDEGAYLITGTDFYNGGINWETCVHVPMKRWDEAKDIQIANGDLLITKDGTVGKVAIVNGLNSPCSLNSGVLRISTANGYDRKFLYWVLQSEVFWTWFSIKNAGNSTILHLYQGDFAEFNYAIPTLPEQQAIAAFLDNRCGQIDVIVADLERQVEILRQYKKALITETVTKGLDKTAPMKGSGIDWIGEMPRHWEMKRLKFLGSARNGLTYAPEDVVDEDKGTLVLRSSNIQNDRLTFDDNVYVNCRIPKEIVLQENDLLICSRNGSQALIGKCALIDEKTAGQTYGAFMCVYRSRYNKFIHYVFLSDIFSYYLGTFLTSTVNQLTNLNLYNIQIPIPMDLNEQQAIVEFLDHKCAEVDDLIAEKQKAAETMRQYKKSLIYEYVTGKKRVTG
ncbi:restriction endonuclease subunit S [Dehalococcoides mccartyi]|uniref:restriction endonuclease subunit S n=1 Tax=Dehalococcoides mccartyi TaxID=61435 RepID=UPI003D12DB33|nr:restriction endonuclease subunit S [Sphaerochaetaceae bacterium]